MSAKRSAESIARRKAYSLAYNKKNRAKINQQQKKRKLTTCAGLALALYGSARNRAVKRKQDFDLSLDFVVGGVTAAVQSGRCTVAPGPRKASIDRIDSCKGYTMDNVQFIPEWLNYAYHNWEKTVVEDAIRAEFSR